MPAGFRNDFFLAVDVLALQGDTKIFFFYRTTYTDRRKDSTRKKKWFCAKCSSISVLISHDLNLLQLLLV